MPSSPNIDFVKVIRRLAESDVDFVLIGGLATQMHGGNTVTFDSDFALERGRQNARAIVAALAPYHPRPADWPGDLPFIWDEQTIMSNSILTLETDLGRIDLINEPLGAPNYKHLKEGANVFELDGLTVFVASIEDLIAMKKASNRPKDQGHIAELETLRTLSQESPSS